MTRVFRDEDVTHVDGEVNPESDLTTIQTELILADLQTIEKAIPRLEKEARTKKELAAVLAGTRQAQEALESGTPVISLIRSGALDGVLVRELSLLTAKPYIFVFNCDADELGDDELRARMQALVAPHEAIFLDAKFEAELVELDDDDEAREMLHEMGVDEPGLETLARVGFDTLGLQTYLTAGPKETRAWTIRKGATAPEAAGVIHTDFQRGFIKAEIVSFDDLMTAGSMLKAKEAGKVRIEGKDYVMADGDVVEFRFGQLYLEEVDRDSARRAAKLGAGYSGVSVVACRPKNAASTDEGQRQSSRPPSGPVSEPVHSARRDEHERSWADALGRVSVGVEGVRPFKDVEGLCLVVGVRRVVEAWFLPRLSERPMAAGLRPGGHPRDMRPLQTHRQDDAVALG